MLDTIIMMNDKTMEKLNEITREQQDDGKKSRRNHRPRKQRCQETIKWGNDGTRERRNEETTERGSDTTSALLKILVNMNAFLFFPRSQSIFFNENTKSHCAPL
jgi:hypothetical protein